MSAHQPDPRIEIEPLISYPKKAEAGKTYVMTVDLRQTATSEAWPYEDEEYVIHFMLDSMPLFNSEPIGDPSVVLHRFGGTYGPAMFILTANEKEMFGNMRLTLVNEWGVPVDVIEIPGVQVTAEEVKSRASDVWFMRESAAATDAAETRRETGGAAAAPPASVPAAPPGFNLRHTLKAGQGHADGCLTWSPDGKILVLLSDNLRLWDAETGELLRTLKTDGDFSAGSVVYAPNGEFLAVQYRDKMIEIWETKTWSLWRVLGGNGERTARFAWSPDGRRLASGSVDESIKVWDVDAGTWLQNLKSPQSLALSVAWSPDGRTLASGGSDNTVRVWDASSGRARSVLEGHSAAVNAVAWSPDGQTLASGGSDHAIVLWSAQTGSSEYIIDRHTNSVTSLSFSADNRLLASKSADGIVMLWRCDTWENVATLDEHSAGGRASSPAFHPSQPVLATLDEQHKVVCIWDLDLNTLLQAAPATENAPPEVVEQGDEAIKEYFRQRREVGIDYLAEAKLIILGEAGAGKTSLARKIKDPSYELQPREASTEGIDVIRWDFPCAVRVKKGKREELHQTEFKVNIWNFGGQEIYHATHQFFLTRRSLYLLVTDDRKEDTDFNYWLQVVALRSDRSPLLIVQNEKQDRQRPLDLGTLRARFPNLRGALRVNLFDNRGLAELEKTIRQELERLPHIGTPLPKTWSQVRAALENDPRNYISLEEFLDICQQNGFKRRDDKLQLSGYLHDLGICLHFQEDIVLKNTVILKPKWGTDAVYSVLDDREVRDRQGRFGPEDLARIWADEKYADMRDELLRLMMRFQLCYQLPDSPVYIAPQLLPPTRPAYEWKHAGTLVLRYGYEFMPKGLVTHFIVALNHLIEDQSLVWKSGIILAREGARAEVIEDYSRRQITVRVGGPDARGLLAIVDDRLEQIHASFPRLKYEKYLPCNCEVCRGREEPYAYPLSELKDFAAKGASIQCRVSGDLVDAARLISDLLPKEVFVSYAWSDESEAVVNQLQQAFEDRDIKFIRDKNEMRYKDSIRDFMQRIGRGKCVVVVLSKKYLESKSCMFELTQIAGRGDVRDRVFTVVLDDAKIYDAMARLDYIDYWEQKKKALDARIKKVGGQQLQGIREELDLFDDIRNTITDIVDILADMNTLTPEQHEGTNFDALLRALEACLTE